MFLLVVLLAAGWLTLSGESKVHQRTSLTQRLRPPGHKSGAKETLYNLVVILHRGISRKLRQERDILSKEERLKLEDLKAYMELIIRRYESSNSKKTQKGRSRAKMLTEALNHPITMLNSLNNN